VRSLPFTTLRIEAGEPWFWERHVERLRETAVALGLPIPSARELFDALPRTVGGTLRVRVTVGADGSLGVDAEPYEDPVEPWSLRPVPVDPDRDMVRFKTTNRAHYEVARGKCDEEQDALLYRQTSVCDKGQDVEEQAEIRTVLEATVANLFFEIDGRIVTPPDSEPLLPGIARQLVLECVEGATEAHVSGADALRARACCATNALFGVHPVGAIAGWREYESEDLARRLMDAVRSE